MKSLILAILFISSLAAASEIKVGAVKGDVSVRRGTSEQWTTVAAGDVLKPEDSIRLGKHAGATLITGEDRKLVVPEMVMLDLADVRTLTQEELLLQLAMERVRSVPDRKHGDDLSIPRTTTIHGANKGAANQAALIASPEAGAQALNGVKVLYQNGFFGTTVLRAKELYRLMPDLSKNVESRLLVASALEKMDVHAEALAEYNDIAAGQLSADQRVDVQRHITSLKAASK